MININTLNQNNNYSLGKPQIKTPFSTLAMGETTTTSGNMGKLIPIFYKELQPSQTINTRQAINIQFTPFVTNLLHQIKGELISYFVPYRLLWNEWEDFVTGGKDGTANPVMPTTSILKILNTILTSNDKYEKDLKLDLIHLCIEKQKVLTKRIEDYNTQGLASKKEAAEIAKEFGRFMQAVLANTTAPETFLSTDIVNRAKKWERTLNALMRGYPYIFESSIPDELAIELNTYEEVVQKIFMGTQWDYLGLPFSMAHLVYWIFTKTSTVENANQYNSIKQTRDNVLNKEVMTLPFDAYTKIYNDWIRLADWETEIDTKPYTVEEANYDWDYFTRARRYQIRGAMPTIPVLGGQEFELGDGSSHYYATLTKKPDGDYTFNIMGEETDQLVLSRTQQIAKQTNGIGEILESKQYAEFTDVMTAAALMNYFSANARIRPRYAEHLLSRWNVRIQDARLQLSEFVGINEINITSQGVVQTSAGGTDQTQQGNITGQLWGNGSNMQIGYKAQEHGILITLLSIKPANSYEQGYPMWLRKKTRFDMPIPEMVNLPDMPIMKDELDPFAHESGIIGYKAIYDEYRTNINKVTGLLRPSNSQGLASYTMARKIFNPEIETITKCRPDLSRIKQYLKQPDFILMTAISTQTAIPLPYTSDIRLML